MNKTCPKCNTLMKKGIAYTQGHGFSLMWRVGKVFKRQLLKNPMLDEGVYLDTYKCPTCGYLEFWEDESLKDRT